MVDKVIEAILAGGQQAAGGTKEVQAFANALRRGDDNTSLLPMLRHTDSRVVEAGAWIASEVVDDSTASPVISELLMLIDHPSDNVRFWTSGALCQRADSNNPEIVGRLVELVADSSSSVSLAALFFLCRVPDEVLRSLSATPLWRIVASLCEPVHLEKIRMLATSTDGFEQRIGVAAVLRNVDQCDPLFEEAKSYCDEEVQSRFDKFPRRRGFG